MPLQSVRVQLSSKLSWKMSKKKKIEVCAFKSRTRGESANDKIVSTNKWRTAESQTAARKRFKFIAPTCAICIHSTPLLWPLGKVYGESSLWHLSWMRSEECGFSERVKISFEIILYLFFQYLKG